VNVTAHNNSVAAAVSTTVHASLHTAKANATIADIMSHTSIVSTLPGTKIRLQCKNCKNSRWQKTVV